MTPDSVQSPSAILAGFSSPRFLAMKKGINPTRKPPTVPLTCPQRLYH